MYFLYTTYQLCFPKSGIIKKCLFSYDFKTQNIQENSCHNRGKNIVHPRLYQLYQNKHTRHENW